MAAPSAEIFIIRHRVLDPSPQIYAGSSISARGCLRLSFIAYQSRLLFNLQEMVQAVSISRPPLDFSTRNEAECGDQANHRKRLTVSRQSSTVPDERAIPAMLTTPCIATDSTGDERPASWFPCRARPRFGTDRFFAAMVNRLGGQATL
jgi:hypothetical protein